MLRLIGEGAATTAAAFGAWKLAGLGSPAVQVWLASLDLSIPNESLGFFRKLYYTLVTSVRDFAFLRFALLFLAAYALLRRLILRIGRALADLRAGGDLRPSRRDADASRPLVVSAAAGGAIGLAVGAGRAVIAIALLFVYTTLFPTAPVTAYVQASDVYETGAKAIIEPITGRFIQSRAPVLARTLEQEFNRLVQRRYEIEDVHVPQEIAAAAREITAGAKTDEQKARALYRWVGTRIAYDYDKVRLYEEKGIWKEQTPEDTFATRKGVCIDYARLYAAVARSVGLNAKVVTGLGYDGWGGYGPHAWNEVYIGERNRWIPLDATWATSGNWFDPPHFEQTHIRKV